MHGGGAIRDHQDRGDDWAEASEGTDLDRADRNHKPYPLLWYGLHCAPEVRFPHPGHAPQLEVAVVVGQR